MPTVKIDNNSKGQYLYSFTENTASNNTQYYIPYMIFHKLLLYVQPEYILHVKCVAHIFGYSQLYSTDK